VSAEWSFAAEGACAPTDNLLFYCTKCGQVYEHLCRDFGPAPHFRYQGGLCFTCPPDRYNLNVSLECLSFIGWPVSEAVLTHQLQVELNFFDHPAHPRNHHGT